VRPKRMRTVRQRDASRPVRNFKEPTDLARAASIVPPAIYLPAGPVRPHSPRHSCVRRPSPAQPGGGRHTYVAKRGRVTRLRRVGRRSGRAAKHHIRSLMLSVELVGPGRIWTTQVGCLVDPVGSSG
jgi:hypothetical protein